MNNTQKISLKDLVVDESIYDSSRLSDDAIERYQEMYANGKTKTICVQAKTNKIIDGVHRYYAATKEKIESLYAQVYDVADSELRALAYQFNRKHGIPYSTIQRNQLIGNLYLKDGKSPLQIGSVVELSERHIYRILEIDTVSNTDTPSAGRPAKLDPKNYPAILRLLIAGEKQEEVFDKFGVSQSTISDFWAKKRDEILKEYQYKDNDEMVSGGKLKKEVAQEFELSCEEIDKVLQQHGDPINFEPIYTSFWPAFGIDNKYGQKHKGHIPARLVQNILFFYSKPGYIILDPFAGGGVVEDVCSDMVNRKCYSYDYNPKSKKVEEHNI